jgi:hypothetical protein
MELADAASSEKEKRGRSETEQIPSDPSGFRLPPQPFLAEGRFAMIWFPEFMSWERF